MAQSEIERAARLAAHLPGIETASWYGTPALKVAGKGIARVRRPGVLMVLCPLGLKEALLEAEPDLYFETPHYAGWPALLVRLDAIDDERLRDRLECAWRQKAPARLIKDHEGREGGARGARG
ncbi:MAG TPA: MmcQ/YjbR family DNA-binding protein [Allosphingosinicella sp.]|nr:MmcQ/YjbR family DNA-binding protein [Allosphingosinicella sp.]